MTSLWRRTSDLMAGSRIEWPCPGVLEEVFRTVMFSDLMMVVRLKATVI